MSWFQRMYFDVSIFKMKAQFKMLKDLGRKFRAERDDKIANFKEIQQFNLKLKVASIVNK